MKQVRARRRKEKKMNKKRELLKLLRRQQALKREQRKILSACDIYEPHSPEWEEKIDEAIAFHGPLFFGQIEIDRLKEELGRR